MNIELTFDLMPVVGAFIAVVGFFLPALSKKYNALAPDVKQLAYAGVVILVAVVTALLSYFGFVDIYSGEGWRYWVWTPTVDIVYGFLGIAGIYLPFNKIADRVPRKE